MRVAVVLAVALLLTGCTWVQKELGTAQPAPVPPPGVPETARPEPVRPPHKPRPQRPLPPTPSAAVQAPASPPAPPAPPAPDYSARCHAMAANRADDAKDLGASAPDQAKVESDTYRDCMAQSVK